MALTSMSAPSINRVRTRQHVRTLSMDTSVSAIRDTLGRGVRQTSTSVCRLPATMERHV